MTLETKLRMFESVISVWRHARARSGDEELAQVVLI